MTEPGQGGEGRDDIPEAVTERGRRLRFSAIWIVPAVAAVIGIVLAYQALSQRGPTVTIQFLSAAGLEAGKTKVKYKDVDIGQVSQIRVSDDLAHVEVVADLVKSAESYLTEEARFWVERARVQGGRVSGLNTLLSGPYIAIEPGREGERRLDFVGLESPPVSVRGLPGRRYTLHAASLGSLEVGVPVLYRNIRVGEVLSYVLDEDGKGVTVDIFVHEPYYLFVRRASRFWHASGLDLQLTTEGIVLDTESFGTLLNGGVAFEMPPQVEASPLADENEAFTLHADRRTAFALQYDKRLRFLIHFQESVRGLSVGAPVELFGTKIGQVLDIDLVVDLNTLKVDVPVLVEIYPEAVSYRGELPHSTDAVTQGAMPLVSHWVSQGMRAQLQIGNLLTGQHFVEFAFFPNAESARLSMEGDVPVIPSIATGLEGIGQRVDNILAKIETLPLEALVKNLVTATESLDKTLRQVDRLAGRFDRELTPAIVAAMEQGRVTLEAAEDTLAAEAPLQQDLQSTLQEVGEAARTLRIFLDYLERHPEALLRGKGGGE